MATTGKLDISSNINIELGKSETEQGVMRWRLHNGFMGTTDHRRLHHVSAFPYVIRKWIYGNQRPQMAPSCERISLWDQGRCILSERFVILFLSEKFHVKCWPGAWYFVAPQGCWLFLWHQLLFVGSTFFKKKSLVVQSCLTLCHPMDCSLPGSSVHGILQTRTVE